MEAEQIFIGMLLVVFSVCVLFVDRTGAETKSPSPPVSKLRKDHPRLFLNKQTLPAVRARALGPEKANYEKLKAWLDKAAANPKKSPSHRQLGINNAYLLGGNAFVYLISGEKVYLDRARKLLDQCASYFRRCDREGRAIHWYAYSRMNAIVAYDWLFNDLSAEDRKRIGRMLLDHVEAAQKPIPRQSQAENVNLKVAEWNRRNMGGHMGGMYGPPNLPWYVGLAVYGEGIDDKQAARFLNLGYERHMKLLAWRRKMAGDDSGAASATTVYAMDNYPLAEFNFFHTIESAFDVNVAEQWPHAAQFVNWVMWNWITGPKVPMGFGAGDSFHIDNRLPISFMFGHLAQIRHFYGRSVPDCAALAKWMQGQLPKKQQQYLLRTQWPKRPFLLFPFLLTQIDKSPPAKPPSKLLPPARHFKTMGQIFMRSGSGPDDTYALFTTGSITNQHKHFDENNFLIYRKGHLALDTGTRPEPGIHLSHFYCRTIAHNCILIHMPGEKMPYHWGVPAPGEGKPEVPNDGGMNKEIGAKVKAFETHKAFTYIASDATPCYNEKKCALALRQFVFVPPNHFVILDRVTAVKPEYKKTFLLHSPVKPKIEGDTFSWAYEGGRLFCRTLLPAKAEITKVGGPGKQFWCDGRNWSLPPKWRYVKRTNPLLGQWRVEVSPTKAQKADFLLHLIEVGDRKTLTRMCESKVLQNGKDVGVEFQAGDRKVTVMFKTTGPPAGTIRIVEKGSTTERNFTNKVQKQIGLAGSVPEKK
ncbi:MAG: heparinase II/III family protein [Phycisphaerae bacterium]|nr:heparinase II/III family protein [Phycisphaerae bacterium]